MTYKITAKDGEEYFIDATVAEIKSSIFEKVWEAMEWEKVEKHNTNEELEAVEDLSENNIELI